jgi:hypothetical protein
MSFLGECRHETCESECGRFRSEVPRNTWRRVRFDITGTYYTRNDAQNLDGSYTGFVSNDLGAIVPGTLPRWKRYAVLSWDSGP